MQHNQLKNIFNKSLVVLFSVVVILSTAFSCSLPTNFFGSQTQTTLGILKQDPDVRSDGFVRANSVTGVDGKVETQGLSKVSVVKFVRHSKDELFIITKEKGMFKSTDAAVNWSRMYIIPVDSTNGDNNTRSKENSSKISQNDALIINDIAVDPLDSKNIYVALSDNKVGKIYKSSDGGDTWREIFKEVSNNVAVNLITINPLNNKQVYAVLAEGAVIKSLDAGDTWQKIRNFRDVPIQMGFVPEFNNLFFLLFNRNGLAFSTDGGDVWELQNLTKTPSEIGENQPRDTLDFGFVQNSSFGRYEKIVPVTTGITLDQATKKPIPTNANRPWILIADRQIWVSQNGGVNFTKLILPAQDEQLSLYDIAYNPQVGLNNLYVSINNKLFITNNRGQSWNTQDQINLSPEIGNISQIIIEPENPNIVYLSLIDKKFSRQNGFFGF